MARPLYQTILILLALLLLTTTTSSTPLPSCISPNPDQPLWTLSDWSTDFTIPTGDAVNFRLSNKLTGYGARCFRSGPYPEGECIWAEGGIGEEDDTGTLFSYNERVEELEVYQEWSCAENGVRKRVKADGKVMVLEQCGVGEEMPKGEMCGLQGGEGVIYVNRIEMEDENGVSR